MHVFKRVVIPLDGSELAERTLPYVANLVKTGCAEGVTIVSVIEAFDSPYVGVEPAFAGDGYPELGKRALAGAREYLDATQMRLASQGLTVDTRVLKGVPAIAIVDFAKSNGADLIVIGTHGRTGLGQLMLGSVANKVVHSAPCPVLLVRPES